MSKRMSPEHIFLPSARIGFAYRLCGIWRNADCKALIPSYAERFAQSLPRIAIPHSQAPHFEVSFLLCRRECLSNSILAFARIGFAYVRHANISGVMRSTLSYFRQSGTSVSNLTPHSHTPFSLVYFLLILIYDTSFMGCHFYYVEENADSTPASKTLGDCRSRYSLCILFRLVATILQPT